ncbi:arginine decarboxylase [Loktanella sp. D2R18]|uniref:biosynthetic arginine decarboxylase n=1 Tax=Rhodobacterales TaxID=204455 RepID=UPI000DEB1AB1|nr:MULTISPECIES: biosynthetic arginine decarboxylase [Rhodobacterales]MDO6592183.1 biosynthetic arginine decarboxylase [Yoonia sp. 1_MG-2023]RBW43416.1 arginine decarboxylase [Loktanella sp. D2R18]
MKNDAQVVSDIYGFSLWSDGLVDVTDSGDLALCNPNDDTPPVSLPQVMDALAQRGISAPIQLRVQPFLDRSLARLHDAFAKAFQEAKYRGVYRGVFPVKVNQQSDVVERLTEAGRSYHFGLEVGSKPELLIALAQSLSPEALLICNGAKDAAFIHLAILSQKLGFNTVIVLESLYEFETVHRIAAELDVRPTLGVRIKLTETVTGKWQASSGDRSVFGLSALDVVKLTTRLEETGLMDCLVLQHTHLGSQVPNILDVRRAATEACRFYVELSRMGAPLQYLDLGGGLGVDYTGERRPDENSVNYTVDEYCANLVETVGYATEEAGIEHPTIVTESGRFVVAQSAIFVFDILGATLYDNLEKIEIQDGDHHLLSDLLAVEGYIDGPRLQEALNDAIYYRDEIRALFRRGQIDLQLLARAEQAFLYLLSRFKVATKSDAYAGQIDEQLTGFVDYYHGNFSLFQSLPDVWAIDQLHPIMPLQRLNEEPTRSAILTDITCDSDGKIDQFVLADGTAGALPVHELRGGEDYYIGVFFVGAYQETLGDLHNLFGDPNVVTISLDGAGGFDIEHETEGDTIAQVLSYVEYDPQDCLATFRKTVEKAVKAGKVNASERRTMIAAYKNSLAGSTYFGTEN